MATDLVNLGFAQIYLTLMIDGVGSPPFSATTLPPFDAPPQSFVSEVIANSRAMFGKPRAEVERSIQQVQDENPLVMEAPKKKTYSTSSSSAPKVPVPTAVPVPMPTMQKAEEVKKEMAKVIPAYRKTTPSTPKSRPAEPQRPPLEGSQSLKDALAQALGAKPANKPETPKQPQVHAPDLKSTLHTVAPKAEASAPYVPPPHPPRTMAELPEDELRSMLAVDESLDNERP